MKSIKLQGPGGLFLSALIIFAASCSIVDLDGIKEKANGDYYGYNINDERFVGYWSPVDEEITVDFSFDAYGNFYQHQIFSKDDGTVQFMGTLTCFKGIFITRNNMITMEATHAHGEFLNYSIGLHPYDYSNGFLGKYYSFEELESFLPSGTLDSEDFTVTYRYSFYGDYLNFYGDDNVVTFRKQY